MNRWNYWNQQGLRDFQKAKLDFEYEIVNHQIILQKKHTQDALDAADCIIRFCESVLNKQR